MKPLVTLLKIRRHQSHDDSLFTEINKKLVDNIMLGIEEVTGNRGGRSLEKLHLGIFVSLECVHLACSPGPHSRELDCTIVDVAQQSPRKSHLLLELLRHQMACPFGRIMNSCFILLFVHV